MTKYFWIVITSFILCATCQGPDGSGDSAAKLSKAKDASPKVVYNKPVDTKRPIEGAIQIEINQVEAATGEEACVSLSTKNFNNILGIQYSIQFDPAQLKYKESRNFGLPSLSLGNFGATKAGEGSINFLWFDMNVKGVSIPDNKILYDLCFDVLAKKGTSCSISITGKPTKIEIVGPNKTKLDLESKVGKINVK